MIIYTYVDESLGESRYYLTLGPCVISEYENWDKTAFNPYFMNTVRGFDLSIQSGRNSFLEFLGDFAPEVYKGMYDYQGLPYFQYALDIYPASANKQKELSIIREFVLDYFFPKYWNSYLNEYARSEKEEDLKEAYRRWFDKFAHVLCATFKKYFILISALQSKESSLLAQLESWSYAVNRFNDTPQDRGTFADDAHTTNIAENDTKAGSDFETPIKRIREIRDNLEVYYNAWAEDFDKLFIRIQESL